ncbi:MAG: cAMP receptor protein [Pelotomaculum sp. PtaU1.Bin035]|nr:MAG: cAMP receptor protein [Pelotomaculum sp. PtaU1.Bin035]
MNLEILANILRKVSFFEDLDCPLQELAGKMCLERFGKDANIFYEGEKGTRLYLILSGKVLIYSGVSSGQEFAIQTLGPSDFLGEMSLLDGGLRSAGARTLEESVLSYLERKDFLDFINSNPKAAIKVIEMLSKRLRQSNVRNKILSETNRRLSDRQRDQSLDPSVKMDKQDRVFNDKQVQNNNDRQEQTLIDAQECDSGETEEFIFAEMLEEQLAQAEKNIEEKKDIQEKEIDYKDMLYYKKAVCPVCETKIETPKVLSKYAQIGKIDFDFCHHYKLINPLFYEIIICPACGFAFNEDVSNMLWKKEQREEMKLRLYAFWQGKSLKDYSGVRTLEQAIETFLLILFTLKNRPAKKSQEGMLYLKVAWLYRYKGDENREQKYIEKAISCLSLAFEKESFSSPKSEINTAYLLGVLNLNTGNNQEAARWLDRVLRHPSKSMFPVVVNQTRELWAEVRQKLREEKQQ